MMLFETAYSTFKEKKILEINSLHKPPALGIGTLRNHEILTGSVEPLLFHRQSRWLMKGVRDSEWIVFVLFRNRGRAMTILRNLRSDKI